MGYGSRDARPHTGPADHLPGRRPNGGRNRSCPRRASVRNLVSFVHQSSCGNQYLRQSQPCGRGFLQYSLVYPYQSPWFRTSSVHYSTNCSVIQSAITCIPANPQNEQRKTPANRSKPGSKGSTPSSHLILSTRPPLVKLNLALLQAKSRSPHVLHHARQLRCPLRLYCGSSTTVARGSTQWNRAYPRFGSCFQEREPGWAVIDLSFHISELEKSVQICTLENVTL